MKNFLYIFEDGTLKVGSKPTNDDISAVEDGFMSVVNMKTKEEYVPGAGWSEIEQTDSDDDSMDEDDEF